MIVPVKLSSIDRVSLSMSGFTAHQVCLAGFDLGLSMLNSKVTFTGVSSRVKFGPTVSLALSATLERHSLWRRGVFPWPSMRIIFWPLLTGVFEPCGTGVP